MEYKEHVISWCMKLLIFISFSTFAIVVCVVDANLLPDWAMLDKKLYTDLVVKCLIQII